MYNLNLSEKLADSNLQVMVQAYGPGGAAAAAVDWHVVSFDDSDSDVHPFLHIAIDQTVADILLAT